MRLYIVRHGESENNLVHRHSGWSQTNLTEKGIGDARRAGRILKDISFDKIYASDLPRTVQTCQNALPGCAFEPLELIREINVGSLSDRFTKDCLAEYGEDYVLRKKDSDYTPWGGENGEMLRVRVGEFMKLLEESPYENVAAFSHGVFIKTLLSIVQEEPILSRISVPGNGGVAVFEFRDGKWSVLHWNLTDEPENE